MYKKETFYLNFRYEMTKRNIFLQNYCYHNKKKLKFID